MVLFYFSCLQESMAHYYLRKATIKYHLLESQSGDRGSGLASLLPFCKGMTILSGGPSSLGPFKSSPWAQLSSLRALAPLPILGEKMLGMPRRQFLGILRNIWTFFSFSKMVSIPLTNKYFSKEKLYLIFWIHPNPTVTTDNLLPLY